MQNKIQIIIQPCSIEVLISNHKERTLEYGKHITHWLKGSTCSNTTKCNPLPRYTYLYNKIHGNAKLHKLILFNKHKGVHVGKIFTFALITKLKT